MELLTDTKVIRALFHASMDQSLCPLNAGVLSMELTDTKVIRAFFSVWTKVCVP